MRSKNQVSGIEVAEEDGELTILYVQPSDYTVHGDSCVITQISVTDSERWWSAGYDHKLLRNKYGKVYWESGNWVWVGPSVANDVNACRLPQNWLFLR